MQQYIQQTAPYKDADDLVTSMYQPGSGFVVDARDIDVAPDGQQSVLGFIHNSVALMFIYQQS